MPPKKREREQELPKIVPKPEDVQSDRELFLQAFEKPTQIYRFLRTRNLVSPLFLPRTLTYMTQRMSRTHKARKNFPLNNLMKKVEAKAKLHAKSNSLGDYMTITFTGFFYKDADSYNSHANIEAFILKFCHKKRKDVSSPVTKNAVGKCDLSINNEPSMEKHEKCSEAISIPIESFSLPSNGSLFKSYILLFKITITNNRNCRRLCNGDSEQVPPSKRLRKDGLIDDEINKRKIYVAELVVYDKHKRCLLINGDYELCLQEHQMKPAITKSSTWETIGDSHMPYLSSPFEAFGGAPILKFHLKWSMKPTNGKVEMPLPVSTAIERISTRNGNKKNSESSSLSGVYPESDGKDVIKEPAKKTRIFYQFLYSNNTRQQTEAREDMHCPWCSLDCITLYSLLKHLKLCHSRFIFTYTPHAQGARIDVAISECYDGSYAGNPHDLHSTGYAFTRSGPVRRTSVTNVLVCRPKRLQNSLSEFLEADDTDDGPRPYVMGHNRLYYHIGSYLPVRPQEMLTVDSEADSDPEWLRIKTKKMIDDFTDVNEGEKEIMKMWNIHIMHSGFVGDCQIPLACSKFVQSSWKDILDKKLYNNFVLHMCNLHDFGLIGAAVLYKTINMLLAYKTDQSAS